MLLKQSREVLINHVHVVPALQHYKANDRGLVLSHCVDKAETNDIRVLN